VPSEAKWRHNLHNEGFFLEPEGSMVTAKESFQVEQISATSRS
jgi:hypothetical protein